MQHMGMIVSMCVAPGLRDVQVMFICYTSQGILTYVGLQLLQAAASL